LVTVLAPGGTYSLATVERSTQKLERFGPDTFPGNPQPSLSPDGKWVAYAEPSMQTAPVIYVRNFPPTVKYRVDTGVNPFWASNSRKLYFVGVVGSAGIASVTVTTNAGFEFSKSPETVPRPQPLGGGPNLPRQYDIAPDGEHFVIVSVTDRDAQSPTQPHVRVVLNWFEELKARVPTK
jgi:Tol biopolymer transport system component